MRQPSFEEILDEARKAAIASEHYELMHALIHGKPPNNEGLRQTYEGLIDMAWSRLWLDKKIKA